MNARHHNFVLLLLLVLLAACGEDFLDLKPVNSRNSETAFQTEEDIALAVNGAYDPLQERFFYGTSDGVPAGHGMFAAGIMSMGEHRSDNTYPPPNGLDQFWNDRWNDFSRFRLTAENTILADLYYKCYQGIHACNKVLQAVEEVEMSEAKYAQYTGEMYFLRGFYHFMLALNFGGCPVIDQVFESPEQAYQLTRPTEEETFAQVESDFREAAGRLPQKKSYSGPDIGRATQGAALGMLGKAMLQQRKWREAIEAFDELIALNEYKLNGRFEDCFAGELANINPESIFEVQFKFDDNNRSETGRYSTWSTYYEIAAPTPEALNSFYPNDKRYALTIGRGGSPVRDAFIKYPGFEKTPYLFGIYDGDNFVALRYADILLSYGEAENELNGPTQKAFDMLNAVHAHPRTGLAPFTIDSLPDQQRFREELRRERRVELAWEGQRWYDLKRYGDEYLLQVMNAFLAGKEGGKSMEAYQILYPIPQQEISLNPNIRQNPGW
jgi:tetratricopeptide (TPR) repeat protein